MDAKQDPGSGKTSPRRFPLWGALVFVVVAGLAVGTWAITEQGVNRQINALLKNDAAQIELLLQSTLSSLQGELRGTAAVTASSGFSPSVFAQQAAPLLAQPHASVGVVDLSGPSPHVAVASGADLHQGQALPADVAAVARSASTGLAAGLVHLGGATFVAIAASPSTQPHVVGLEISPVDVSKPAPNRTGPYAKVYVNVYAAPRISAGALVLTTFGPGALPQPVATSSLRVGAVNWLIAVSPKESPIGGVAQAAPWLVLGLVLFVALVLAVFVEVLARRQRYASALVDARTAELVEAQRTMVRQERLAAIGEMASVVSHELRNPLSAVVNDLFLVRRRAEPELNADSERHLANAEREVYRAARLSEDLLSYARERDPQLADVDLEALVQEVLENIPTPDDISVSVDASVWFRADPALMTQVVGNLVINAYQAMPEGGTVRLSARHDDGVTEIVVQDAGPGIDPEVASRLFDPFFTTKEGGTGLGLAIVHRLVEAHHGQVTIDNVPEGGARVSIRIPGSGTA